MRHIKKTEELKNIQKRKSKKGRIDRNIRKKIQVTEKDKKTKSKAKQQETNRTEEKN